jgi:hypothetical protein
MDNNSNNNNEELFQYLQTHQTQIEALNRIVSDSLRKQTEIYKFIENVTSKMMAFEIQVNLLIVESQSGGRVAGTSTLATTHMFFPKSKRP